MEGSKAKVLASASNLYVVEHEGRMMTVTETQGLIFVPGDQERPVPVAVEQAVRDSLDPTHGTWWLVTHREWDKPVRTYALGSKEDLDWAIRVGEFKGVEGFTRVVDGELIQTLDDSTIDEIDGCNVVSIGPLQYYHRGM